MGKYLNLIILIILSAATYLINIRFQNINLDLLSYTLIILSIVYLIVKIGIEQILLRKIKGNKSRYSIRKLTTIITFLIALIIISNLWVKDPSSLLVAYGIIGAGIAISLQDLIKNFVGGIVLILTRQYRVGDRIEINLTTGDVMDIGIMSTTLLELKGWVSGDQATGRIVSVPNGQILNQNVTNYTKGHNFLWDELSIPLTHDSDWKSAVKEIKSLLDKETKDNVIKAQKDLSTLEKKYYIEERPTAPSVYVELTDNWTMLHIRYISTVRERRLIKDDLNRKIIDLFKKLKKVKIASESYNITITK